MRKYSIAGLILLIFGLASCNTDNESATYNESGVSLLWNKSEVVVGPNDTSFEVRVTRGTTFGTETINLTSSGDSQFSVPSSITFADGESAALINVAFSALEFDTKYSLTINLDEDKLSVSGIGSAKLTISKEYNWISLGMGKFQDNWALGLEYDVEILKADGFERYRVMNPYATGYKNDDGDWGDWIAGTGPAYIEFWALTGDLVQFKTYKMGLNYEAKTSQAIEAYYPTDLSSNLNGNFNKKIGAGEYQLAPYYYVAALEGGWNNTAKDKIIIIKLP